MAQCVQEVQTFQNPEFMATKYLYFQVKIEKLSHTIQNSGINLKAFTHVLQDCVPGFNLILFFFSLETAIKLAFQMVYG